MADTMPTTQRGKQSEGGNGSQPGEQPSPGTELPPASWRRQHVLDVDDFSLDEIDLVLNTTDAMREVMDRPVPRTPALRGKTVFTLFYEQSTRTRASFELAGKSLGADVINITADSSSVQKGESLIDTVRTLQATKADVLVIRHYASGAPYLAAAHGEDWHVVNGGDGSHAHPTQALLDLYTIRARLGDIRGLKVAIVGDIMYSRVARSNIWALTTAGARVTLCGPPTLLPFGLEGIREQDGGEERELPVVEVERHLDRALEGASVVMALRLQRERQQSGLLPSLREYTEQYQITRERLVHAQDHAFVMHPGPMNPGIELSQEVAYGVQSLIEEQVTNGVALRMALLYLLTTGRQNQQEGEDHAESHRVPVAEL